jgi:hypothetical protein
MTARCPRILALGILFGAVVLTACSSSAPGGQPKPAIHTSGASASAGGGGAAADSAHPCSLLTQTEVNTAVGQPLGPGKQTTTLDDCQWTTSDFAAGVSISLSDWPAIKAAATGNGHTPESVPGIGDEALTNGGGLLYVRKGDAGFLLTINGPNVDSLPDQGLTREKALATAVVARL